MATVAIATVLAAPCFGADYPLPDPPPGSRLDYEADEVDFEQDRSLLHLRGHVTLRESTWTVRGDELWLDTEHRRGTSRGPLLVEDGASAVYGEAGEFDFLAHTGKLQRTNAGHADWRINAREAELGEGKTLHYRGGDFTSCSAKPPHYHFRASSITVRPKQSIWARNVRFYLGEVPVFYLPVLYKSLKPRHVLRWKTQPGFDRRNGVFAKNTLTTDHGPWTYSKLYADYYMRQGFGFGGELQRRKGEDSRGAVLGYAIRETSTNDRRWAILGQNYQALASSIAFQGRLQTQSDADFNNHYARSSTFRVTPELVNSGAIVKTFSRGTGRIVYERRDVSDISRRLFIKERESYPRIELQSTPFRVGRLSWLNSLSGTADQSYDRARPFIERSVSGGWEATRTYGVARGVSFAPKLGFRETWYNRLDQVQVVGGSKTVYDAVVGRPRAAGTLRFDTPLGGTDLTYGYAQRLKSGSFQQDAASPDKGVEENGLTLSDAFIPHPRVYARLSTGYDFRTFRDRTIGFRQRVQPFTADASWQAGRRLAFTMRDEYQLDEGNRAAIFDARWGDEESSAAGFGFAWNRSRSRNYVASMDFAVAPSSPTWRLAFGIRAQAESDRGVRGLHGFEIFEKEVSWTKRWHDFYTKVGGRFRPGGVGEASIRVDLKFGAFDPKQAPRRDWEAEWFPDRARSDDLRP